MLNADMNLQRGAMLLLCSLSLLWQRVHPLKKSETVPKQEGQAGNGVVWWQLLRLLASTSGGEPDRAEQVQEGVPWTTWRQMGWRGTTWQWRSPRGAWIAWRYSREDLTSPPDSAVQEGGGLLLITEPGSTVSGATWTKASNSATQWQWHSGEQLRSGVWTISGVAALPLLWGLRQQGDGTLQLTLNGSAVQAASRQRREHFTVDPLAILLQSVAVILATALESPPQSTENKWLPSQRTWGISWRNDTYDENSIFTNQLVNLRETRSAAESLSARQVASPLGISNLSQDRSFTGKRSLRIARAPHRSKLNRRERQKLRKNRRERRRGSRNRPQFRARRSPSDVSVDTRWARVDVRRDSWPAWAERLARLMFSGSSQARGTNTNSPLDF